MALEAIIFDFYETLVVLPEAPRVRMFDDLARRLGVTLAAGEAYRHWRERTTRDTALRLRAHDRPPLGGALLPFRSFREVWQRRFGELFRAWRVDASPDVGVEAYFRAHGDAPAYPDVHKTLGTLRGRYRLAVLSDADTDFLSASIDRNGFAFDAVVDSEGAGVYKPHVSIFREACARLDVEPAQAAYVGDSPWADVAGARHAGLRAVWLNRHGREWPNDIEPPETTIASLAELPATLES